MFALRYIARQQPTLRRSFAAVTKFSKEHEWVRYDEATKVGWIGITDHAQNELGDIVFLKSPEINSQCKQNDSIGEIESVKAVASLYTPISGTVVEVNGQLENDYSVLNSVN